MNKYTLLITALLIAQIGLSQSVDERAKERAEQKTNNRVDSKIDEGLDKGLDAIEGLFKRKKKKKSKESEEESSSQQEIQEKDASNSESSESMGGYDVSAFLKPAPYEESYTFHTEMMIQMDMTDKKGKTETMNQTWLHGDDLTGMIMSGDEVDGTNTVVFDQKNQSMVTLMDTEEGKQGMSLPMMDFSTNGDEDAWSEVNEDYSFTKTGKTKEILGYSCDEYAFTSDDYTGTAWITNEAGVDMMTMMSGFMGGMDKKQNKNMDSAMIWGQDGLMMESNSVNDKGEKTHYLVTGLKTDASVRVNTGNYKMINGMGGR